MEYENNTVEELEELYQKNKMKINYYNNKIKNKENYELIFIAIMFFSSWAFGILGIYCIFKSDILKIILGSLFIISNVGIYMHVDFDKDDNKSIEYLKNENNKIELILKFKRDRN